MAFTSAIIDRGVQGTMKVVRGTYLSDGGSTGGDIETGLKVVRSITLTPTGSSADASAPTANETFPLKNGGAVTIVTIANGAGIWEATGK